MSATQDQIVASASELIWRQGYHNTSVDQIIQEAGVCKGNFYYYFASKDALGLAVIDAWVDAYERSLVRPALSSPGSAAERLERFIDANVRFIDANVEAQSGAFAGCPLGRMALEMGDLDESFRLRLEQAFDLWRRYLREALEGAGVGDAEEFARFMIAALQGAFLLTKVERDGAVLASIARQLKEQLRMRLARSLV